MHEFSLINPCIHYANTHMHTLHRVACIQKLRTQTCYVTRTTHRHTQTCAHNPHTVHVGVHARTGTKTLR